MEDGGPSSGGINEFGKQTVELYAFYKVAADGKDYDLYFADCTVNQVEDPNNVGLYALGVAPYSADPRTASGAPKPFFAWTGSHYNDNGITYGDPGVYVAEK